MEYFLNRERYIVDRFPNSKTWVGQNWAAGGSVNRREATFPILSFAEKIKSQRRARTLALYAATHRLYLLAAKYDERAVNTRPASLPGSVKLLAFELKQVSFIDR